MEREGREWGWRERRKDGKTRVEKERRQQDKKDLGKRGGGGGGGMRRVKRER